MLQGYLIAKALTIVDSLPPRWRLDLLESPRCLRLVPALAVETHEGWLEEHRYLNMGLLVEQKKEQMRMLEEAAAQDSRHTTASGRS